MNSLILRTQVGPFYHSWVEKWSIWWGNHSTRRKSALVLLCPQKIWHDLKWNRGPISVHLVSQKFSCQNVATQPHSTYFHLYSASLRDTLRLLPEIKKINSEEPITNQTMKRRTWDCNFPTARTCHERTLSYVIPHCVRNVCHIYLTRFHVMMSDNLANI